MSGLYNMLMGKNPAYPALMAFAGIHQENFELFGRLRDAWITEDGKTVGVLHRNYGEEGQRANDIAATLTGFREGGSCSDFTYGFWLFEVPDHLSTQARRVAGTSDNTPCWERYQKAVADMQAGKDTPQTRHMRVADILIKAIVSEKYSDSKDWVFYKHGEKVGEQIIGGLSKSVEDGKPRSIETEDGSVDIITPREDP